MRVFGTAEIEFDVPDSPTGTFHVRITQDALSGKFANGFAVRLRRGKSLWQQ